MCTCFKEPLPPISSTAMQALKKIHLKKKVYNVISNRISVLFSQVLHYEVEILILFCPLFFPLAQRFEWQ